MSFSSYINASPIPSVSPTPYYDPYRGYREWYDEPEDCPGRRNVYSVLWGLTATYLAAAIAYGQLQYALQGEKSVLRIAYKIVILIIFHLFPAISLLVELFRAVRSWRGGGRHDNVFLRSRISGMRVTRPDGTSESLDLRHLSQYSWVRRDSRRVVRLVQVVILIFASSQSLGTLVRTSSRLHMYARRRPTMGAFLASDFEAFFLSIGALAILIKSWLAFVMNVEWRSDSEHALRALDMSSRTQRRQRVRVFTENGSYVSPMEIISEVFLEFQTRAIILLVLYLVSWIVLGIISRRILIVFAAWTCVSVLAIAWLQRSEAEAISGGKEVFVSGFCASFLLLIPRALFYINEIRRHPLRRIYWTPKLLPWPLIVLGIMTTARILFLQRRQLSYSSWQSKTSHLGMVTLGAMLLIVIPAYVFTEAVISGTQRCIEEVHPDPIWVPSF